MRIVDVGDLGIYVKRLGSLIILLGGRRIGVLRQVEAGRLTLEYDEDWRNSPTPTPLSHSMPADRVGAILAGSGEVVWLTEDDLVRRLGLLSANPEDRHLSESGQFSLAGMQATTGPVP
ncbi:MAG: HipA N-terminal domain-containing protein [Micromonosporaceae bacterium]|nr:HipA N-terminal domain-containing protein [Micromonosporaceae bacterium]